jgi:predicted DNA-binding protein
MKTSLAPSLARREAADEDTTTIRLPTELRNNLKKIAYIQGQTLRELTDAILSKYVTAYEAGIDRTLASLQRARSKP